ncbi:right-handed parallel beta-helix repeat-containing protein [Microlunatus flavus]|uniref:Right handed beta helix region n=1 Tax=Microlunatus flavus TaxID=1036181 RepID=A0A1H9MH23_9ACTN|nr:right-handed parallel beta-helix repeat-containing protein [Microlunatus flavus]SER23016.1 Right handed beta helix region [Microlunatus flavus]
MPDVPYALPRSPRSPRRRRTAALGVALLLGVGASVAATAPASADPGRTPARTLVVSTHGDDAASGSARHPLASVAAAVRRLPAGGTVLLRGGRYDERISLGAAVHDLVIKPYRHEHPVLDGTGLAVPDGRSAMVALDGSRDVTVEGLEVTGYRTTAIDAMPIGVYVHGAARDVTLRGLHVHHLGNDNGTLGSFDLNAHGIAVYGDSVDHPITGLRIEDNEVDHLVLGASESVVVNGNVDGWRVSRNDIHDNNNIGIDAIGYEPTLPEPYRYSDRNRARNGVIDHNTVRNIISKGNPSYYEDGGWCNCADGIYVDGGTRIRVERNRVSGSDIGVEVAAENAKGSADHVLVSRNVITRSAYVGIATGGYCNGSEACGGEQTGRSHDNRFERNTLYANNQLDDGSPEVLVQYYAYRNTFSRNRVWATNDAHAVLGTVDGAGDDGLSTPLRADHNRYWTTGGHRREATFGSLGTTYTGFDTYRKATGQDRHSRFAKFHLPR